MKEKLTVKEYAKRARVTRKSVYRLIRQGLLKIDTQEGRLVVLVGDEDLALLDQEVAEEGQSDELLIQDLEEEVERQQQLILDLESELDVLRRKDPFPEGAGIKEILKSIEHKLTQMSLQMDEQEVRIRELVAGQAQLKQAVQKDDPERKRWLGFRREDR